MSYNPPMRLSKLKIIGFKSLAEQVVLEFPKLNPSSASKGVTAIVGPNGSGKSNIADAIRWVLGEQSLKIIRAKSAADIIFGGSTKKSRLNRSEAVIYLSDIQENSKLNLPYQEIEISRRFYRNGETKYFINNQEVRLFDITMLLAEANFGQKNYTVIGQGIIDSILQTSPQAKLDFFYDAVGVKKYQIKLNKAQNKLNRTTDSLKETKLLLSETAPHLKYLTRQAQKWDQRNKIEAEFKKTAQIYYSLKINDLTSRLAEKKQEYQLLDQQHQQALFKLEKLREQVRQMAQVESAETEYQELQKIISQKNQTKNKLLAEKIYLDNEIESNFEKAGQSDLAWIYRRQSEYQEQTTEQEANLNLLKNAINNLKQTIDGKSRDREKINQKIQALEQAGRNLEKINPRPDFSKIKQVLVEIKNLIQNYYQNRQAKNSTDTALLALANQKIDNLIARLSDEPIADKNKLAETARRINDLKRQKEELTALLNDFNLELKVNLAKRDFSINNLSRLQREQKELQFKLDKSANQPNKSELLQQKQKQKEQIEEQIKEANGYLDFYQEKINKFNQKQEKNKQKLLNWERQNQTEQKTADHLANLISVVKIDLAKLEEQRLNLDKEILTNLGKGFAPQKLEQKPYNLAELWAEICRRQKQLSLIGPADEEVIKEYQELKSRHAFLTEQSQDLEQTVFSLSKIIKKLEQKIKIEFSEKFKILNLEFKKYFKTLFTGGNAELKVCEAEPASEENLDNLDEAGEQMPLPNNDQPAPTANPQDRLRPKEKGIEILASPPGKKIKNIAMLSGGEKAITFCALICAIIASNPPPFVVLDEIDAALDEANSIKLAVILKELSAKTQFILITHNRAVMEAADILYGVSMDETGVSKILSLKLEEN